MLKAFRDLIYTVVILVAIGVVVTLIPVITAVISGLGLLAVFGSIGVVIYAGMKELDGKKQINNKDPTGPDKE